MPTWTATLVVVILTTSAVVTAIGVIWKKVISPLLELNTEVKVTVPVLRALTTLFSNAPNVLSVLKDMGDQFKTDDGSSLRDVVNRLEDAAIEAKTAIEKLITSADLARLAAEGSRVLAESDRERVDRLIALLAGVDLRVQANTASVNRVEAGAAVVAEDLAAAHGRADAQSATDPGAASDAAWQSALPEENS